MKEFFCLNSSLLNTFSNVILKYAAVQKKSALHILSKFDKNSNNLKKKSHPISGSCLNPCSGNHLLILTMAYFRKLFTHTKSREV